MSIIWRQVIMVSLIWVTLKTPTLVGESGTYILCKHSYSQYGSQGASNVFWWKHFFLVVSQAPCL